MRYFFSLHRYFSLIGFFLCGVFFLPLVQAIGWQPITQEDREASVSSIEPDAGAEVLFRYAEFNDEYESEGSAGHEYVRIKVYNEKGVRLLSKIDVPYVDDYKIRRLAARIIKPDGTIIYLQDKEIYNRDIVKSETRHVKVLSFSFPTLAAGDIVEYKWDLHSEEHAYGISLRLMHELPTRKLVLRAKPFLPPGVKADVFYYRCQRQKFEQQPDGFFALELRNIAARREEAFMPPEDEAQSWILIYPMLAYDKPADFWPGVGRRAGAEMEVFLKKKSKLIESTAAEIVAGAAGAGERGRRINDYCRDNLINTSLAAFAAKSAESASRKERVFPEDTLRLRQGKRAEILAAFLALARAAGLDARVALCADHSRAFFREAIRLETLLPKRIAAIRDGEGWLFFDPASPWCPSGSLWFYNEGVPALVCGPKTTEWAVTQSPSAEKTRVKRIARLKLLADGTLEGQLDFEFFGQQEALERISFFDKTPEQTAEIMRKRIRSRLPNIEVFDLQMPDIRKFSAPLRISYSIRVPGYADCTGNRMFFEPCYFEKGRAPKFAEDIREHDIHFPYSDSNEDIVSIELPEGYEMDALGAPRSMAAGAWGNYNVSLSFRDSMRTVVYNRKFMFLPLQVLKGGYPQIKGLFEEIARRDAHIIALKKRDDGTK